MIVQKKWEYEDNLRNMKEQQLQLEQKKSALMLGHGRNMKKNQHLALKEESSI